MGFTATYIYPLLLMLIRLYSIGKVYKCDTGWVDGVVRYGDLITQKRTPTRPTKPKMLSDHVIDKTIFHKIA